MRPAAARGRASVIPNICAPDAPPWQALREGRRRGKEKDARDRECARIPAVVPWDDEHVARRGSEHACLPPPARRSPHRLDARREAHFCATAGVAHKPSGASYPSEKADSANGRKISPSLPSSLLTRAPAWCPCMVPLHRLRYATTMLCRRLASEVTPEFLKKRDPNPPRVTPPPASPIHHQA